MSRHLLTDDHPRGEEGGWLGAGQKMGEDPSTNNRVSL